MASGLSGSILRQISIIFSALPGSPASIASAPLFRYHSGSSSAGPSSAARSRYPAALSAFSRRSSASPMPQCASAYRGSALIESAKRFWASA